MDIVRQSPGIAVLRDDCNPDSPQMKIEIDPDRANLVGITNADVATSTAAAIDGNPVGIFKEGNKNIPIIVRLRSQDRARLSQIENLYVNSSQENVKVPKHRPSRRRPESGLQNRFLVSAGNAITKQSSEFGRTIAR
jgi:multidrug efflux pump subunit AcrB